MSGPELCLGYSWGYSGAVAWATRDDDDDDDGRVYGRGECERGMLRHRCLRQ